MTPTINIDLPKNVQTAVQKILDFECLTATPAQTVNLKRLQRYIRIMKDGAEKAPGRPRIPMRQLIIRHMDRIAPDMMWIKRVALRVSIGSYRTYEELNGELDEMIREGIITQNNDQIQYGGGE
jgi:hypothetical protein